MGFPAHSVFKFVATMNEHEITRRKGMPCKQNEYCKTKFNQCYPSNPSIQNFCKIVHGLCLCTKSTKKTQRHGLEVIQSRCLRYARRVVDSTSISNKDSLGTSIFGLSPFFVTMNEHEITYRKDMFCKQNEYCKTKFN